MIWERWDMRRACSGEKGGIVFSRGAFLWSRDRSFDLPPALVVKAAAAPQIRSFLGQKAFGFRLKSKAFGELRD